MNLYELSKETRKAAEEMFDPETGEVIPEKEKAFEDMEGSLKAKALSYCYFIKEFNAQADAIKKEADKMMLRSKSYKAKAERMKDRIQELIEYGTECENAHSKLKWSTSESVHILDESKPVKGYMIEKVTTSPDKKAIKEAIKSNKKVDNAIIKKNKNLRIG